MRTVPGSRGPAAVRTNSGGSKGAGDRRGGEGRGTQHTARFTGLINAEQMTCD